MIQLNSDTDPITFDLGFFLHFCKEIYTQKRIQNIYIKLRE